MLVLSFGPSRHKEGTDAHLSQRHGRVAVVPVFFRFPASDLGIDDDEARLLAGRLRSGALQSEIVARTRDEQRPLVVDMDGGDPVELYQALEGLQAGGELPSGLANLLTLVADSLGERTWTVRVHARDGSRRERMCTYQGLLPEVGAEILVTDPEEPDGQTIRARVIRRTPEDEHVQVSARELFRFEDIGRAAALSRQRIAKILAELDDE